MGELFALLQHQAPRESWFTMILQDLARLAMFLPEHEVLATARSQEPAELASYCLQGLQHVKALSKLSKWAIKHYTAYLGIWKAFRRFQQLFEADATQYGFAWTVEQPATNAPATHECPTRQAIFPTYKALCTHTYKKHSELNLVQQYAIGNTCRSCLKVYHSRSQLVHHLKYMRTGCLHCHCSANARARKDRSDAAAARTEPTTKAQTQGSPAQAACSSRSWAPQALAMAQRQQVPP